MPDIELCYLDLLEVGRQIHAKEKTSVQVTESVLGRINSIDCKLASYSTVMASQALAEAKQADKEIQSGHIRGLLHGVPVALKDLLWTVDAPTSHGMPLHRDFFAKEDATTVHRLRTAGAVILGKLQMTEGAYAVHHPVVAAPVNPWGKTLWPGVSSSGSGVATAAGLCFAALGTDTAGSIRFPSAANGVTGLKPTWGRVSRHGAFGLAASMDHIGPMARSAADVAAVLQAIAGQDPKDPTSSHEAVPDYLASMTQGLQGLTVGLDVEWCLERVDSATRFALDAAIEIIKQAGGTIRKVKFPGDDQIVRSWGPLCAVETAIEHEATFPSRRSEYGPALTALIDSAHSISAIEHHKRVLQRDAFRGRLHSLFNTVDLLLAPVTPDSGITNDDIAARWADPDRAIGMIRYTTPFDLSGHPSITLPAGRTPNGAPLGIQFIAGHFAEDFLIRAGWAYQQASSWHLAHPDL